MNIENDYFLASFQNKYDCEKVLSEGSWIIFDQYLIVQLWTLSFNLAQNFPNAIMAWIRFPRLPSYFYRRKLLKEIGGLIGKVAKLDLNIDNKVRGRFARMAVYINLDTPLISQVLINRKVQRIEYDFFPTVCFNCGRYSHVKEGCDKPSSNPSLVNDLLSMAHLSTTSTTVTTECKEVTDS